MPRRVPLFLRLVMRLGWLVGAAAALVIVGFLALSSGGFGPYTVNGAPVSKENFLAFALPILSGYLLFSLMLIATSWGLYRDRAWSRQLLLSLVVACALFGTGIGLAAGLPLAQMALATLGSALMVTSLWWYLYRDDDVVAYYDSVASRPEDGFETPS